MEWNKSLENLICDEPNWSAKEINQQQEI